LIGKVYERNVGCHASSLLSANKKARSLLLYEQERLACCVAALLRTTVCSSL
jgi:hypothetical protein